MKFITQKYLLTLLALFGLCLTSGAAQPNIIYILADDMGYGDIRSLNEQDGVPTPNMDRIVQEGIHFTDFTLIRRSAPRRDTAC